MKSASFDYVRAETLEAALRSISDAAGEAAVLAGGQTLMPLLALRLALPGVLVDINHIAELQGITRLGNATRIGATTRQADILADPLVGRHIPGLAMATRFVGHQQTRNRGTIGGSLALAEPAAEYPATALALGAEIEVQSLDGKRLIAADEFFVGPYTTTLQPDEILSAVHFPDWPSGARTVVHEVARRAGDFALVGLVCAVAVEGGRISRAGVAWFGMGPTPMRSRQAEQALVGRPPADLDLAAIAALAASETEPTDDIHASAEYRRTVAQRVFPRVLRQALQQQAAS